MWLTSKGTFARNSSSYLISGKFHRRATTSMMKLLFAYCLLGGADGRTQKQAMAAADGKLQCIVGLAIPMDFGMPWYSHIILKGTTSRSLPSAWPDNMLCACTETHWHNIESMLAFVTFLDNKLQRQSSAPDPGSFSSMLLRSTLRVLFALRFPSTSIYATSIPAARPWHSRRTLE